MFFRKFCPIHNVSLAVARLWCGFGIVLQSEETAPGTSTVFFFRVLVPGNCWGKPKKSMAEGTYFFYAIDLVMNLGIFSSLFLGKAM
jgi:hypothetical protein